MDDFTSRQKAILLAEFVRNNNLTGILEGQSYHDLRNNFIGLALRDNEHPSLPLISVVIYCCIAERIGLEARPCGFPFHVIAIIDAPTGVTLDGQDAGEDPGPDTMYMDPFRSADEVPVRDLKSQLDYYGTRGHSHASLLAASSVGEIVLRSSRNIMKSVQEANMNERIQAESGNSEHSMFPDVESAFYAALWASLLGISPGGDTPLAMAVNRRQHLPYLVEHFETHFPTDIGLVEKYALPLFTDAPEYSQLRDAIRIMRHGDSVPKQIHPRNHASRDVKYCVGQLFRHRRYHYQAVITGWDAECGAGEHWMQQMGVDNLSRGRHQSFYHALYATSAILRIDNVLTSW